MKFKILAVGKKMPSWVQAGYEEYAKRLPKDYELSLVEVDMAARSKQADLQRLLQQEETALLSAIPKQSKVIGLAIQGQSWDTLSFAKKLAEWQQHYSQCCFLIGGPDGLSSGALNACHEKWSLSALTLPHPLVRVILAEQLYRAYSVLVRHPYHK